MYVYTAMQVYIYMYVITFYASITTASRCQIWYFLRFQKLSLHAWCCTQPPCADSNAICSTISPSWPEKMLDELSAIGSHWRGKQGPSWEKKELSFLSNSLLHNFRQSSSTKPSCPNKDLLLSPSLHLHRASSLRITWWQCIDRPCFHCFGQLHLVI